MIGDNIKRLRKASGMSQDELAEKLNVTRQSVSLWENGQSQPTIDNILALAKLFGITTDELLLAQEGTAPAAAVPPAGNGGGKKKNVLWIVLAAAVVVIAVVLAVVLTRCSDDPVSEPAQTEAPADTTALMTDPADTEVPDTDLPGKRDLYGYLKRYVETFGGRGWDYSIIERTADLYGGNRDDDFQLAYWSLSDSVEFGLHRVTDDTFCVDFYLTVPKHPSVYYDFSVYCSYRSDGSVTSELEGTIDASRFTESSPLTVSRYVGAEEDRDDLTETGRSGICELIGCIGQFLITEGLEYDIHDLGFVNF